ncbi:MAG TPA: hypothetical protein PLZ57_15735 [Pseudobdellovibrionaceae bacterium]|nr:hypothetical protein [Pseudobdellovibrionaceae bacterium]
MRLHELRSDLQNYLERVLGLERLSTEVLAAGQESGPSADATFAVGPGQAPRARIWLWDFSGDLEKSGPNLLKLREMAEKLEQAIAQLWTGIEASPQLQWWPKPGEAPQVHSGDWVLGFGATAQASANAAKLGYQLKLLPSLAELHQSPQLKKQAWQDIRSVCSPRSRI